MKVLGVLAGPRKGGSTDMTIDSILEGLKDSGAEVKKISLYDFDIKPCKGCGSCEKGYECPIQDEQNNVLELMDKADVVVFGSPTYWSNVTSQTKLFFDRSIPFFEQTKMGPRRTADRPGKVVLVTSCGIPYPLSHIFGVATGCIRAMKTFFGYMKVRVKTFYVTGMLDADKSRPSKRVLEKAYKLGRSIAVK